MWKATLRTTKILYSHVMLVSRTLLQEHHAPLTIVCEFSPTELSASAEHESLELYFECECVRGTRNSAWLTSWESRPAASAEMTPGGRRARAPCTTCRSLRAMHVTVVVRVLYLSPRLCTLFWRCVVLLRDYTWAAALYLHFQRGRVAKKKSESRVKKRRALRQRSYMFIAGYWSVIWRRYSDQTWRVCTDCQTRAQICLVMVRPRFCRL